MNFTLGPPSCCTDGPDNIGYRHPAGYARLGSFAVACRGRYACRVIPETSYARLGDLHLAYQVLGEGPPDILPLDYWISHVEAQ